MMELKIMYFVHGTTVDNAAGKCSGWKLKKYVINMDWC